MFLSILTAPLWAPVVAIALAWTCLRHGGLAADERLGYGGRVFRCYRLRLAPRETVVTPLHPEDGAKAEVAVIMPNAEGRHAKWRLALLRLPQILNVVRGDMSLVGPLPLSREQLDPLKTAKRYYLSARPGVIGICPVADADEEEASQYRLYALSWSLMTDAIIAWDSLLRPRERSELGGPQALKLAQPQSKPIVVRRSVSS